MDAIGLGTALFIGIVMAAALAAFGLCVRSVRAEQAERDGTTS